MKRLLPALAVLVIFAGFWIHGRTTAAELKITAARLREENASIQQARRENAHLRSLAPTLEEREALRRAAAESEELRAVLARSEASSRPAATADFPVGNWVADAAWQNRGTATPHATVETTLWAAAGGDTSTLVQMLDLSPELRARADRLLNQLPADTRALYRDPETLISAWTIKNIPVGAAQIVWSHQADDDHAVVGIFVKNPSAAPASDAIVPAHTEVTTDGAKRAVDAVPPSQAQNRRNTATILSLRRVEGAWRLTVPDNALERLARELGRPSQR